MFKRAISVVLLALAASTSLHINAADAAPRAARNDGKGPAEARPALRTPTDACGNRVRKADGSYWTCTLSEQFNGSTLNQRIWSVQTTAATGFGGRECFVDDPDNVSVSGGYLHLTVRREPAPVACPHLGGDQSAVTDLTGGMITSYGKFAQAYGRFAFRVKFPATKVAGAATAGTQSALWLWPQDQARYGTWPGSGEIDVAEFYSTYPDRLIPFLHYTPVDDSYQVTNNYCLVPDLDQAFHDVVLEWTPTTISISYDGLPPCVRTGWRSTLGGTAPFDQPFLLSLTQALGVYGNAPTPSTVLPATMTIDSVRVWK